MQELKSVLKQKWQTVMVFVLLFAGLAFVVSVFLPQKYRSEQRLLLVQSYGQEVDPYAVTRSTEYLTGLLTEVMYSDKFINQVINSGFGVSEEVFPEVPKERKKFWKKTLRTSEKGDTGIIDISIYHENQYTTGQIAQAVGHVVTTQHGEYHSRGNSVQVQTIDPATTSESPVDPNIPLNTAAGAVLGTIAGLAFVYLFPRQEVNLLGALDEHKLVPAFEPDWSQPVAVPSRTDFVYEESEIKSPLGARKQSEETVYTPAPPTNLPIA